jgi:hypothetical protein
MLQSQDRTHRPGQTKPVSYYYQLATGPHGQKTIDHIVYKALVNNQNLAEFTAKAWDRALREE